MNKPSPAAAWSLPLPLISSPETHGAVLSANQKRTLRFERLVRFAVLLALVLVGGTVSAQQRTTPTQLWYPNFATGVAGVVRYFRTAEEAARDACVSGGTTLVSTTSLAGTLPGTTVEFQCSIGGGGINVQARCAPPGTVFIPNETPTTGTTIHTGLFALPTKCFWPGTDPNKTVGNPCAQGCGNPVHSRTGNKFQLEVDYESSGSFPMRFARFYNSVAISPDQAGAQWRHSFQSRVVANPASWFPGSPVWVYRPEGHVYFFQDELTPEGDVADRLERITDSSGGVTGWRYLTADGDRVETYDISGTLLSIANRAGLTQLLAYSDASTPVSVAPIPGLLIRVTDPFGREIRLTYDSQKRLIKMTNPDGQEHVYSYDAANNLSAVSYPDAKTRIYHYNEPANTSGAQLPNHLTGVTDENGSRYVTWQYNSQGRAITSERADGVERVTFQYNANNTTNVVDAFNQTRTYGFNVGLGVPRLTGISGPVGPQYGPASATYDENRHLVSRTDWNGNKACLTHDERGLETLRTEGLPSGATCPSSGSLPAEARTITTEWHPVYRLPLRVAEPKRITTYVYGEPTDPSPGNRGSVLSKTIQPTSDANGSQGFSATPVGSGRTWIYTYNQNGQVLTVDGPRTDASDVTTYAYYPNNDPDPGKRGNLATITNAAGHATQITAYNAHGQPLTIVDPNGLTTTLTYDARQRLTSRSVGGETTSFEYDGVGQVTKVTLPDGSFLTYAYDAAHRLTAIADSLGNRIAYTLDAMGNRTREDVFDPGNQLAQTRSRVYSSLNRLDQEIGGTNPTAQITRFAYDSQGNVTGITDPLNRVTANAYDALNRLKQMTDPANGLTRYAYDGLDQLTSVTDPRNNATSYTLDGLGNLSAQSSPDTGSTVNTLDAAGNLLSSADAKGQTTSYTYDVLNRVARIVYNQATGTQLKQVDYLYDQGANGIGRLATITETAAAGGVLQTTTYAYDQRGRIISEARAIGGATYTTAYSYDAAGRMTGVTYPSGRTLAYGLDGLGRVNRIETTGGGTTEVVVQNVTYQPFGPVKSFTFGNLQTNVRSFDLDGRTAAHSLANQTKLLSFDAASRITRIEQQGVPTNFAIYGYDVLDRLTSTALPTSGYSYGYDAVGNRLSRSAGASTDTYTYPAASNRLAQITGSSPRTYAHDANGSITSDGVKGFGYDARGRLVSSTSSVGATSYQVNALGQRVRKTSSLGDTIYHYDNQGRLIAESTAAGALVREYVWLGDQPVAMIAPQLAAGTEVIVDNGDPGFSAQGTWPVSTAVSGYLGANYQTHEAGGAPPGSIVIDNTDGGFTTLGIWPVSTAVSGYLGTNYQTHAANGEEPAAVVVDNGAGNAVGTWPASTSVSGYLGANYQTHTAGTGTASFTWTGVLPQAGDYRVYALWTSHANRATNAPYTVSHAGGQTQVTVNQQQNGGTWHLLGTFNFAAGATAVSVSDQANGYVVADAVKWVPVGAVPNTATWTPAISTAKDYRVYARWTAHPNRATNARYTITHDGGETPVTVNQQQNTAPWNLLGTFRLVPGAGHRVSLTDQADGYVIADAVRFDPADGPSANTASWSANFASGQYEVYARWTVHPNRATDAKYTVTHASGQTTLTVNQQLAGGAWNLLGSFTLNAQSRVSLSDEANGFVIADAVRFVPTGGQQTGGSTIYYVHADHLNTPRVITDAMQQVVWRWENQEPFGRSLPEENPSGLGNLEYPLRFPGQYRDAETGLFYNYFRDYDPQTGRYVQPDPLGVVITARPTAKTKLNHLYGYVGQDPLRFADPYGLDFMGSPPVPRIPGPPAALPYDTSYGPSAANCAHYPPGILRNICSETPSNPSMNCSRRCLKEYWPGNYSGPGWHYGFWLIPQHPVCWWECNLVPTDFCAPNALTASAQ